MMIEQVARGLAPKGAQRFAEMDGKAFAAQYLAGASQFIDTHWHEYAELARGAIEALRQPTAAMVQAAAGHTDWRHDGLS